MSIVNIKGLTYNYGPKEVLRGLDMTLESGRVTGLLGPNGEGKTTLIKILSGLLQSYQGEVLIDGKQIGTATKALVSYLPEKTYFNRFETINSAIKLFSDFYEDFDKERAMELAKQLELDPKQRIGSMSKGMQEKFQLVLIMSRRAKLYLLDEPLGGIDPIAREQVIDMILKQYEPDSAILLSTHLVHDVEHIFDDVMFLKDGKIVIHRQVDDIREEKGMSLEEYFREVYR